MAGEDRMNAVVITGPREAALREIPKWQPSAGEVLVRCHTAAVCTVERQIFAGLRNVYPSIGGHEVSGIVAERVEPHCGLSVGDRVVIDAVRRCGRCAYCLKGRDHFCDEMRESRRYGGYIRIGGGFAEYTVAPADRLLKLPDWVGLDQASLIEPLACCLHSVNKAKPEAGETVVILGAGTMGAMHVLLSKLAGAKVLVSDVDPGRLAFAARVGADATVNVTNDDPVEFVKLHTDGRGADAVIVTAASRAAGEHAIGMVARLGRVVFYASTHPPVSLELDWNRIHYTECVITGAAGKTAADFREAARLLIDRRVDLAPFITKVIALRELPNELGSTPTGMTQRVVVRHDTAA
jgi:L-iditol 2-dehydrogenase